MKQDEVRRARVPGPLLGFSAETSPVRNVSAKVGEKNSAEVSELDPEDARAFDNIDAQDSPANTQESPGSGSGIPTVPKDTGNGGGSSGQGAPVGVIVKNTGDLAPLDESNRPGNSSGGGGTITVNNSGNLGIPGMRGIKATE